MNFFIFIWNFKIGGIQKHTVLLANYLKAKSWDVTIFYTLKEGDLLDELDPGVTLIQFNMPKTNSILKLYRLSKKLKEMIPANSIVLSNGPNNFRQFGRINRFLGRWRQLFILQNDLELEESLGLWLKKLELRFICNSHRMYIVALSKTQKRDHEERLRIKQLEVIPNFIDYDHNHLAKSNPTDVRGVSLGRYVFQKGYDILLEAMKYAKEGSHLDIYGFGEEERQKLILRAKELSLDNIRFKDACLNVYEVMSQYDYFVLSSRFEPFGIVVAEALSCGLPVLTTDCDGPIDMIDNANGLVVDRNSAEALGHGVNEIHKLVAEGVYEPHEVRQTASRFAIACIANQYLKLLQAKV